ncbi:MAG: hypothetical protein AVDCRST_MAG28-2060 [uncultured Rubrobacteraceae bacterium]|uniref:Uncharacterized protein n=1 Tax=uncultured Rubrobacteraceae bacterium TaxID=349277 RepID=A0A6J4QSJ8_9ACTN|nr:MAG: hypothetical protein AVDCRST_MAG28-2060 [uncultured Rubrobacteraceae bacterium]
MSVSPGEAASSRRTRAIYRSARFRRSWWAVTDNVFGFLAIGGLFAIFGFVGLLQTPTNLGEALRQWAWTLLVFVQAWLCSPSLNGPPRAMFGVRVAAWVVTLAVMSLLVVTSYADGFRFGVVLVAAFLVLILCSYYFANHRRYRRFREDLF